MTGFARQIAETGEGTLTCELKAVNHRYLDVSFRLPDELRAKESALRQQVAEVVKRGKVECSLYWQRRSSDEDDLSIDRELVRRLGDSIEDIVSLLPECKRPDPLDILKWPGVILQPEVKTESLYENTRSLLAATLEALADMRASEGERIADMLRARCGEIRRIAAEVRERLPAVMAAVRQRQKERLDKLDVAADPERLEVELALVAQKLDVDEELDRLDSHIVEILDIMLREDPVGRRLDFLMQELNREANTLGSKSADTETTRAAVDLKVLIEQMREQIQNVQ